VSPDQIEALIEAIGDLWLLGIVVFFTVSVVVLRKQIRGVMERATEMRWRRGDSELTVSQQPTHIEAAPKVGAQAEESLPSDEADLAPNEEAAAASTTPDDPFYEMFHASRDGDRQRLEAAFERAKNAESDAGQKLMVEGWYLHFLYRLGDTTAIDQLQQLAEQVKDFPDVLSIIYGFVGEAYQLGDDFLKANEVYERAAEAAQTDKQRANYIVSSARCLFAAGKRTKSFARLKDEISGSRSREALSTLYGGLADLYHKADNSELRAIALDKAIECNPNDARLRFDAAYSYGENGLRALALMHYQTLLDFQPNNSVALNNIGVTYGELKMPMKQGEFYKKAAGRGETLAFANLAYQYMEAGLSDEASKVLKEAKEKDDVHPNVGNALSALTQRQEAELETEGDVLNASREQRQFLLSFAEAYFSSSSSPQFEGDWRFPDGVEAKVTQNADSLQIRWTQDDKERIITARVQNCGAMVTKYSREGQYYPTSLWDKGYASLSQDNQHLDIMIVKDNKHSFLALERLS